MSYPSALPPDLQLQRSVINQVSRVKRGRPAADLRFQAALKVCRCSK